jgi:RHS repeat-associated protein
VKTKLPLYLLPLLLLGAMGLQIAQAQTPVVEPNFIRSWTAMKPGIGPRAQPDVNPASAPQFENLVSELTPLPVSDCAARTTYIDGFGKVDQEMLSNSAPSGQDRVQTHRYDVFGRELRQYLPFVAGHGGGYQETSLARQASFYTAVWDNIANDNAPWSTVNYETKGPDSRPLRSSGGPGYQWQPGQNHEQHLAYRFNNTASDGNIWKITLPAWRSSRQPSGPPLPFWPEGELAVVESTDPDGRRTITYTDTQGRLVLRKAGLTKAPFGAAAPTEWAQTAYIYDDKSQLRWIIQPEGMQELSMGTTQSDLIARWAFQYDYDSEGRRIRSHTPGGADQWLVYNQAHQVVLSGQVKPGTNASAAITTALLDWRFTKYDNLGRPIQTGIYNPPSLSSSPAAARQQLQEFSDQLHQVGEYLENSSQGFVYTWNRAFPDFPNASLPRESYLLTQTFYDTYLVASRPGGHNFRDVELRGRDLDPLDSNHPGFSVTESDVSQRTTNLVTVQQERIEGNTSLWLTTTTWYDERGRPLQAITDLPNPAGTALAGWERTSWMRDFTGTVQQQVVQHHYQADPNTPLYEVQLYTQYHYDAAGRLVQTDLKIDDQPIVRHSQLHYNELAQLVDKRLHSVDGGHTWMQSLDYRYHIRGWLTQLNNRNLSSNSVPNAEGLDDNNDDPVHDRPDLFGLELRYEQPLDGINTVGEWGGNITSQTWRSNNPLTYDPADGPLIRAYSYDYDGLGRLTGADFRSWAHVPGTPDWKWLKTRGDYSLSGLTYDRNGNLLSLVRMGDGPNGPTDPKPLDKLKFSYTASAAGFPYATNRLQAVSDAVPHTAPTHDFEGITPDRGLNYEYDARGNMLTDQLKDLELVTYSGLNLPTRMEWANGNELRFVYTATGRRLTKVSRPLGSSTNPVGQDHLSTSVGSGFEYEDGELVSIGVPEGRLLHSAAVAADPNQPVARRWQWEYQLKDHLGNLRLAIRMAQPGDGDILIDSFEPGGSARSASSSGVPSAAPPMEHVAAARRRLPLRARTGEHVLLLSTPRGTAGRQVGPTLRRTVTAGDSIHAEVWASFDLPQRPGWPVRPTLGGGAVVPEGMAGKPRPGLLPRLQLSLAGLLALAHRSATDPLPDAYLKLEVYSADSVKQAEAWAYVSDTVPPGQWQRLMAKLSVAQDGYLEVKLVDESPTPVYFDDLLLKISKERGMQENHYDPWGLNLVGIESQPVDRLERKQYNGKERVSEFGLEWNFHDARTLDKQTGRWCQVDPLAEEEGQDAYSSYHFSYDNPVRYSDPNGRNPVILLPYLLAFAETAGAYIAAFASDAAVVATVGATAHAAQRNPLMSISPGLDMSGAYQPGGRNASDSAPSSSGNNEPRRRDQKSKDKTFEGNERAARREAFRQEGVRTGEANNFKRVADPDNNPNLKGTKGQRAELVKAKNQRGEDVVIKHHKNGHRFKDKNPEEYERPHYHNSQGNHISY